MNLGGPTGLGLEFNEITNMLLESSYQGMVLSVCPEETTTGGGVQQYGLLFRNKTLAAGEKKVKACADVRLKAIFVDV